MKKVTIIGAGISGLSCSYHLGHKNCTIFERNKFLGGHIYSHKKDGSTWDEGPHISFTKNSYVQNLFEQSVNGEFLECEANVSNYYKGNWIPHPAQTNLWAVPEPLRKKCLKDFLEINANRHKYKKNPENYSEWIDRAFGKTFAKNFTSIYTSKYWTCDPKELSTDWIGDRVLYPDIDSVLKGSTAKQEKSSHYITKFRYPKKGGYVQFLNKISSGANVNLDHDLEKIDFKNKIITFTNGKKHSFDKLISTIPLTELIKVADGVPDDVRAASETLKCSSTLLVNVTANHLPLKPFHWLYVYDKDKICTRINHIDLLSSNNTPVGKTGIQVEIYSSPYRPFELTQEEISKKVVEELKEMGLIKSAETAHTIFVPFANVIFDNKRKDAQKYIFNWLEQFGLEREEDDLEPMTDWEKKKSKKMGQLILAGRFAQWKYYWSDDCVLRGKFIAGI